MHRTIMELVNELYTNRASYKYNIPANVRELNDLDAFGFPESVRADFFRLREKFQKLKDEPNRVHKVGLPPEEEVSQILDQYREDVVHRIYTSSRRHPIVPG